MMDASLDATKNANNTNINKKPTQINQTRLAAVSNYKLAQLTFAPPRNFTLRKTALIKNLVETVYQHTLNDYLTKPMARWTFFTPDSLEDMTQKDVEKIIYRYTQIIHNTAVAFEKKHIKKEQQFLMTDFPERNQLLLKQQQEEQEQQDKEIPTTVAERATEEDSNEENDLQSYYSTLFLQPNTVFPNESNDDEDYSFESLQQDDLDDGDDETDSSYDSEEESVSSSDEEHEFRSSLGEVFIQNQQDIQDLATSPPHSFGSLVIDSTYSDSNDTNTTTSNGSCGGNRLSWLSDTGVPTTSLALNLASELMSLFDMEFNVDLTVPDLRRLETNNSSTTSLNQVYSVADFNEDDDEDIDDQLAEQILHEGEDILLSQHQPQSFTETLSEDVRNLQSPEESRAIILRDLFENRPIAHHYITENEKKKQQSAPKKVFGLIPTLKHLTGKQQSQQQQQACMDKNDSFEDIENNNSNSSTDNISMSSSSVIRTPSPAYCGQPKHGRTGTPSLSPSTFTTGSQTSKYYSSSSDSEGDEEESNVLSMHHKDNELQDDENESGLLRRKDAFLKKIIPPNRTSSLEYRRSLAGIFELSDDDSETTASYLNDSTDRLSTGIYAARQGTTPVHKGYNINSSNSSSGSIRTSAAYGSSPQQRCSSNLSQQINFDDPIFADSDSNSHFPYGVGYTQSLISPTEKRSSAFDTSSMISTGSKRKSFQRKMAQFLKHKTPGRRRGSSSASSTMYNPSICSMPLTTPPTTKHQYNAPMSLPAAKDTFDPSPTTTATTSNRAEGFFPEDDNTSIASQQYKYRHSPPHTSPTLSKAFITSSTRDTNGSKAAAYSSIRSDSSNSINWTNETMHKPWSPSESLGQHHFSHSNISSDSSLNTINSSKSSLPSPSFMVMNRNSSRLSQCSKSSSSSAMNFFKRLSFHKKDKKLQRA